MENNSLPTMTAEEALNVLTNHFLGSNYYIVDPVHATQANVIIVEEIISKYPISEDKKQEIYERIKKISFNVIFAVVSIIAAIETIYLFLF